MRIGLVYLRPRLVAYFRRRGPDAECSATDALAAWLARMKLRPHISCTYGLSVASSVRQSGNPGHYDACVEIPPEFLHLPTDGLSFQTLPGGAYARARHIGPHEGIRSVFTVVRDGWLTSQAHLALDPHRPLLTIHIGDQDGVLPIKLKSDVCVPVRVACDEAIKASSVGGTAIGHALH